MNRVREAWQAGLPAIGRWQGPLGQLEAERIGGLGYDFVLLDFEDLGTDPKDYIGLTQAVELGGTRTMVRTPVRDPAVIGRFLDSGAIGVVVPGVESAAEAIEIARATRYPPRGRRANGHVRRPSAGYSEANDDVICILMIETAEAWNDLERIAAIDGVDGLMLGQVDLALALGWSIPSGGGIDIARHDDAREALRRLVAITRAHGKIAAAAGSGAQEDSVRTLLELGVRWFGSVDGDPAEPNRQAERVAGWRRDFVTAAR